MRFGGLFKAIPAEVGNGRRLLYFEASNEDIDHQDEVVLQTALKDSAEYFLRHGNIDLSHRTLLGPGNEEYEIGRPLDVRVTGGKTFVEAELYQGDSRQAKNATMVWDSLTKQRPPSRWYPSVGGQVLSKSIRINPGTGARTAVIDRVRWSNIALDRMPVNRTVPTVSTVPVGVFAKSLGGFVIAKTLTAGYGTDSASLAGGAALRSQSLHGAPISYTDFSDRLARLILDLKTGVQPGDLIRTAQEQFGLSEDEAEYRVLRFLKDLKP